jgi:hypothetical protein
MINPIELCFGIENGKDFSKYRSIFDFKFINCFFKDDILELDQNNPLYLNVAELMDTTQFVLLQAIEGVGERMCWGLAGYNNPFVELNVADHMLQDLVNNFGLEKKFSLDSQNSQNRHLRKQEYEKYTYTFDERGTCNLFSVFKNCKLPTQYAILQSKKQPGIWQSLTLEEIKSVYGDDVKYNASCINRRALIERFQQTRLSELKEEHREVTIHRMNMKFGEDNQKRRLLPFSLEMKIILGVGRFTQSGKLRLNFFYDTWINGNLVGFLALRKRGKDQSEKLEKRKLKQIEEKGSSPERDAKKNKKTNPESEEEDVEALRFSLEKARLQLEQCYRNMKSTIPALIETVDSVLN